MAQFLPHRRAGIERRYARKRHAARGRAAWDTAVAATGQRPLWADNDDKEDDNNPFMRPDEAELARRRSRALAAAHASAERARKRRWRRLIKSPTADWRPEEWAFDDRSRGVTVLELALTPRGAEEEEGDEEGAAIYQPLAELALQAQSIQELQESLRS